VRAPGQWCCGRKLESLVGNGAQPARWRKGKEVVSAGRIVDIVVRCVGRCSVGSLNQHHFACAVGVGGSISESEMEMEMEMPRSSDAGVPARSGQVTARSPDPDQFDASGFTCNLKSSQSHFSIKYHTSLIMNGSA
jgi:hypothetical protein